MASLTPAVRKTNPTGSAASWGMVKGLTAMSPISNGWPAWKYSTEGNQVGSSLRDGTRSDDVASVSGPGSGSDAVSIPGETGSKESQPPSAASSPSSASLAPSN